MFERMGKAESAALAQGGFQPDNLRRSNKFRQFITQRHSSTIGQINLPVATTETEPIVVLRDSAWHAAFRSNCSVQQPVVIVLDELFDARP